MKTITLPVRINARSLDVGQLSRTAKIRDARRMLPWGRWERESLSHRIEDGLMLALALTGFGSVGWSLLALW